MKDYRVLVTVKNNRILRLIEAQGFTSVAAFCDHYRIAASLVGLYINQKINPFTKSGAWRGSVMKLAALLQVPPEALFSDEQLNPLENNKAEIEVDFADIRPLLEESYPDPLSQIIHEETAEDCGGIPLTERLANLPPRQRKVLALRYGIDQDKPLTYSEIGKQFEITGTRVMHIEQSALRNLREGIKNTRRP